MQEKPLITIITPVYNLIKSGRERFIRQNIESIHEQTYPNIEHIIQDGASDDGTLELLKKYADKGWIKLYSEKDTSVHDAINKAAIKANGKFLGILGSDDYYKDNNIVQFIVNNYLQDENIEYVYGDQEQINVNDDSYIDTWYGNAHESEFWRGVCYATEAILFSKRIFDEVGMFDLNYPIVADLKLQMQFKFNDYKNAYCNRTIVVFRKGAGLSSNDDTMFYHAKEFAEICSKFWNKFDDTMTPEKAEYMLKHYEYSEEFLMKLRRYIINLKLKNIDYIAFNKQIEELIGIYYAKMENRDSVPVTKDTEIIKPISTTISTFSIYPFKDFPLLKIVERENCKKIFIFDKIPIIKLTKQEKGE